MTSIQIPRITLTDSRAGAIYHYKQTLGDEEASPAIILPETRVYAIGIQVESTASIKIEATISPLSDIENDTAIWSEWDGESLLNTSATCKYKNKLPLHRQHNLFSDSQS